MKYFKIKSKCGIYNYRPRIPIKKIYWEFRKGDADYRPCVPHGHSLEGDKSDGKYKLELWTGNIYEEGTQKLYGVAKKRDMLLLFNNCDFREFVNECREFYQQNNPDFKLPPLKANGKFRIRYHSQIRKMRHIRNRQVISRDRFVVSTDYIEFR